jgi:Family of unknown function (DUF5684)
MIGFLAASSSGALWIYVIAVYLLTTIPFYLIFKKADRPDAWGAFIPIFNYYVLLKVVGRPGWWLILFLIPLVNIIIWIMVLNELSKSFGHGVGFTLGLIFLNIIFFWILALGSSQYRGPAAGGAAMGGAASPPPPPMPTA